MPNGYLFAGKYGEVQIVKANTLDRVTKVYWYHAGRKEAGVRVESHRGEVPDVLERGELAMARWIDPVASSSIDRVDFDEILRRVAEDVYD